MEEKKESFFIKQVCKEGWEITPNVKTRNAIVKAIKRNGGHCPCYNTGHDTMCPCSDFREKEICHCGLYVKK